MILATSLLITVLGADLCSSYLHNRTRNEPYQVSVEVAGQFRCSGAVVNALWLTALASCLHNASADDVIARVGSAVPQRRGSAYRVQKLLINSCKTDGCITDGLALLKVHTRIKFNRKVHPITLWPRTPPTGDVGWAVTWLCHIHVFTTSHRRIEVLDAASCDMGATKPRLMCVSADERPSTDTDDSCQDAGSLVVVRNRLAGLVLRSLNSTIDFCLPIGQYIPWIKKTVVEIE